MTNKVVDIKKFKNKGKAKIVVEDMETCLYALKLVQSALSKFSKYKPIQKIISVINTEQTLLEVQKQKLKIKYVDDEQKS